MVFGSYMVFTRKTKRQVCLLKTILKILLNVFDKKQNYFAYFLFLSSFRNLS